MSEGEYNSKIVVAFGFLVGAFVVVLLGYFLAIAPLEERLSAFETNVDKIEVCDANSSTCTSFSVKERIVELTFANNNAFSSIEDHETRIKKIETFLDQVVSQPAPQSDAA